jgi:dolichol-phosphate mannosyltransferase
MTALWVVVPVMNEEAAIASVLAAWVSVLRPVGDFVLLVVDDGSTDGTPRILGDLVPSIPELRVLRKSNEGHGRACITGYEAALAGGAGWVLQIDSDGQSDPQYFPAFWVLRGDHPAIYGARRKREDGAGRTLVSFLLSLVVFLWTGCFVRDGNVPYRLMRADLLQASIQGIPRSFRLANVAVAVAQQCLVGIQWRPIGFPAAHRTGRGKPPSFFAGEALRLVRDLVVLQVQNPRARSEGLFHAITAGLTMVLWCFALWLDPAFFWWDDFQAELLPVFHDVARALGEGSWPLLSPSSWFANNLAGEYRYGIFSPPQILLSVAVTGTDLPLARQAAVMVLVYLWIAGAGTLRLTRHFGGQASYGVAAALAVAFHGWILCWGARTWFGALASFAWLPWYWLALAGAVDGTLANPSLRRRAVIAGVALAFLVSAGWPFTDLMAVVVTVAVVGSALRARGRIVLRNAALVGVVGVGLSAPSWLALLEYVPDTTRLVPSVPWAETDAWRWMVPWRALGGLLWPLSTPWKGFDRWVLHDSIELFGAAVPLLACGWGISSSKPGARLPRVALVVAAVALGASMLPGLGAFRFSFRWLPLFVLALAVAGVAGARAAPWRGQPFRVGMLAVQLAVSALTVKLVAGHEDVLHWDAELAWRDAGPFGRGGRSLFLVPFVPQQAPDNRWIGNIAMLQGVELFNGYSPMSPTGPTASTEMGFRGFVPDVTVARLADPRGLVHQVLLLAGFDGLLLHTAFRDHVAGLVGVGWVETRTPPTDGIWTYSWSTTIGASAGASGPTYP